MTHTPRSIALVILITAQLGRSECDLDICVMWRQHTCVRYWVSDAWESTEWMNMKVLAAVARVKDQPQIQIFPEVMVLDGDGTQLLTKEDITDLCPAGKLFLLPVRLPQHVIPCYRVGAAAIDDGRTNDGIEWLRAALYHQPRYAPAHVTLAGAMPAEEGETALYHYSVAVALAPPRSYTALLANHNSGLMLRSKGRHEEARKRLKRVVLHAEASSEVAVGANNELSLIDIEEGHYDAAITRLRQRIVLLAPTYLPGQQNLALALYKRAKALRSEGQGHEAALATQELKDWISQIADRRDLSTESQGLHSSKEQTGPCCEPDKYMASCDNIFEATHYIPASDGTSCPEWKVAALRLRRDLESLQLRSQCLPSALKVFQMPSANGFGSIVSYAVSLLAQSFEHRVVMQHASQSLLGYTSPAKCTKRSFECYFEPLTSCPAENITNHEIQVDPRPHFVPSEYKKHGVFWYRSQLLGFFWRLNAHTRIHIEAVKKKIGFTNRSIGIHVRHGDSCSDPRPYTMRKCFPLAIYMQYAESFRQKYNISTIFLATDDSQVISESRQFSNFTIIFVPFDRSRYDSLDFIDEQLEAGTLDPEEEGVSVITDITLLASTDYFIGTFSGNIGRIAYQLSSAWKGYQPPVVSLDIPWCSHWGHRWPVNGKPIAC